MENIEQLSKENQKQELVLKQIYDYCMKVEWRREELDKLANELNVSRERIKELARRYIKKYLNDEEYLKVNQQIDEMIIRDREHLVGKLNKPNPLLYKLNGKVTYYLWDTDEEKEFVLKYIYNFCNKCRYDSRELNKLISVFGISVGGVDKIVRYAKEYAIKYLGYTNKEYHQLRENHGLYKSVSFMNNYPNPSREVFEELLKVTSSEEVISMIDSSNVKIKDLQTNLANYVNVRKGGNDEVRKDLRNKLKMYTDYYSDIRKVQRKKEKDELINQKKELELPKAISIIEKYLSDNKSDAIDKFCKKNSIDKKDFENYVAIIKEKRMDLFNTYNDKINRVRNKRYAIVAGQVERIIRCLNNGIEEYGVTKEFDLIDYFMMTNISLKEVARVAKPIVSNSDLILLKKFVDKNISGIVNKPNVIKDIMEGKYIISYQKDDKGNMIPGTEVIFDDLEKTKLINYLANNRIPINLKTYNLAFKRYQNGTLTFDEGITRK